MGGLPKNTNWGTKSWERLFCWKWKENKTFPDPSIALELAASGENSYLQEKNTNI